MAGSTTTEAVTWHDASTPPDDDTTVLLHHPRLNEPVWLGYHDGGKWWTLDHMRIQSHDVTHWAYMLEGPK